MFPLPFLSFAEITLSVTAYAVPAPPKGGAYGLTDRCVKPPPFGGGGIAQR